MSNWSIKNRLIATLVLFIMVFASFGIFTIVKLRELENVSNNIYEDPIKVSSASIEAMLDINKMQSIIREIFINDSEEKIEEVEAEIAIIEDRVKRNLDEILNHAIYKDSIELENQVRHSFYLYEKIYEQIIADIRNGDIEKADESSQTNSRRLAKNMEDSLAKIDANAKDRAKRLITQAGLVQKDLEKMVFILNAIIVVFFTVVFIVVITSIIRAINTLQSTMYESSITGVLKYAKLEGNNEITGIAKHYNALIEKLKNQFWLKDGQNSLNNEISSVIGLEEMLQKSLSNIVNNIGASKGSIYLYNENTELLELKATFAYTQNDMECNSFALGEGIIGQTALDMKPISLENIGVSGENIPTDIVVGSRLYIYCFPLIWEGTLLGVVQLASFNEFDDLRKEFLREAGRIISSNVYSEIQNLKLKNLLEISEKAQIEARNIADQLQETNHKLEEQQLYLQKQSAILQQTNSELEKKQQLLQQQSAELQYTNMQLEASRLELLKHSGELESANKYKSQFLANMSHELRTPLNSIILLSRLLMKNEKRDLSNEHLDKLKVIYSSGQELLRLINDVLDLSKIEAGKMSVVNEEFHTQDLIKDIKHMFDGALRGKNIKFETQDYVDSKLYGDYYKLAQIIRNLISNAIKFTEEGSINLIIKSHLENDIEIIVKDTGIGILEKDLNRIFEEFHQVENSSSRKYGGTGLGLSISQRLAEIINGKISVESEEGKGSSFTLLLKDIYKPQEKLTTDTDIITKPSGDLYVSEAAASKDTDNSENKKEELILQGKKILIADDDPRNIFVLASALEDFGAEILEAENGEIAIELLEQENIDLVLIDIMMPVMDGYETIEKIRSSNIYGDVPIIAITAKSQKNDKDKCIEVGANDYISKPVDYDIFIKLVNQWIRK